MSGRGTSGRWAVVIGAAIAGLVLWVLAVPVGGVVLDVRTGDSVQRVGWISVLVASLVAGLLAWASLALLDRVATRGRAIWTALAVVVLVLSMGGPLGGVTTGAKLVLAALHLVVGLMLIIGFRRGAERKELVGAERQAAA